MPQFVSPVQGPGGVMMPGVNQTASGTAVSRAAKGTLMDHEADQIRSDELETPLQDFGPSHGFAFDPSEDFADEL
jgi:hypothetical protein